MRTNADDVFIWGCDWCYRKDAACDERVDSWGCPEHILIAETPEWVDFMENVA